MSRPDPADVASDRDCRFFDTHPLRTCRIRPALRGEMPGLELPPDGWVMVLVKQIQPGLRLRVPFDASEIIPDAEATALDVLHEMFWGAT